MQVVTPAVVVAELAEAARRRRINSKTLVGFLLAKSEFAPLTPEIARMAGKINAEHGADGDPWGILESMILATARTYGAKLVTRDPIYLDAGDVEFLGET